MSYTKHGPWTNGASPGIDQSFLNGLENYMNPGVAKTGVPAQSWFGPYTVTTTSTFFNHNLTDANGTAQTPDVCILQITGVSIGAHGVEYDSGTMTTTQVKLTSTDAGGITVVGVAYKF